MTKSEICNHVNVKRIDLRDFIITDDGPLWHVICQDCFEEWVE